MKIRLTCSRVGNNFVHLPGQEIDVDDAEAARMIEAGHGILVEDQTEKHVKPDLPIENAEKIIKSEKATEKIKPKRKRRSNKK